MPSRRWPRLVLACLLLWQLNATVAIAFPHVALVAPATGVPPAHCEQQLHAGGGSTGVPTDGPAPAAPDCCHDHSAPCQCAQPAALSMPALEFREAPPPGPPEVTPAAPSANARAADFFRPPI